MNYQEEVYNIALECRDYLTFFVVFFFVVVVIWLVFQLVRHLSIYF